MPLSNMMTATATTTRNPAIDGNNMIGDPVTHLESVKTTPIMLPNSTRLDSIKKAIGIDGGAVQVFEVYSESHLHTDDSLPVTQIPDILAGDGLIVDSVTYHVRTAEVDSASTSFGKTLRLVLTEDRRK